MFNLNLENYLPVIILIAIISVVIVLFFLFRGCTRKGKSPTRKIDSNITEDLTIEHPISGYEHSLDKEHEFGLHLVLSTNQVVFLELPATIGRSEENTIVIKDDSISDLHAKIYFDNRIGAVCIEDLGSTNGIFVDGRPTTKNVLDDGARLTLGSNSLVFRDTGYLPPTENIRR